MPSSHDDSCNLFCFVLLILHFFFFTFAANSHRPSGTYLLYMTIQRHCFASGFFSPQFSTQDSCQALLTLLNIWHGFISNVGIFSLSSPKFYLNHYFLIDSVSILNSGFSAILCLLTLPAFFKWHFLEKNVFKEEGFHSFTAQSNLTYKWFSTLNTKLDRERYHWSSTFSREFL